MIPPLLTPKDVYVATIFAVSIVALFVYWSGMWRIL